MEMVFPVDGYRVSQRVWSVRQDYSQQLHCSPQSRSQPVSHVALRLEAVEAVTNRLRRTYERASRVSYRSTMQQFPVYR